LLFHLQISAAKLTKSIASAKIIPVKRRRNFISSQRRGFSILNIAVDNVNIPSINEYYAKD